jgi:hypothetical protein
LRIGLVCRDDHASVCLGIVQKIGTGSVGERFRRMKGDIAFGT